MEQTQDTYRIVISEELLKKLSPMNDLSRKLNHQLQKLLNQYPNVADIVTLYTPHALSEEESEAMIKVLILKEELSRIKNLSDA